MKFYFILLFRSCIVAGCYNLPNDEDQIRIYPKEPRLSNSFMTSVAVNSQISLIDSLWDKLIVFCADGKLHLYSMGIIEVNVSGNYIFYVFNFFFFNVRLFFNFLFSY